MILARLLTPEEMGIFSLGIATIGLAHTLRDFGIGNFLIQEKNLTDGILRTCLTASFIMSAGIGFAILTIAPWLADFYEEPGIETVLIVISITFFVLPFSTVAYSLLRREMRFRAIAAVSLLSSLTNAGVSIILATLGFGFTSLAWGAVAGAVVTTISTLIILPTTTAMKPSLKEWRRLGGFSAYATTAAFVGEADQASPDFVIGHALSFEAVGLYSKAVAIIQIVNILIYNAIIPVLVPAMADRLRKGRDIKSLYLKMSKYSSAVVWPICTALAILAEPVLLVLFGSQWVEGAHPVALLCIATMINAAIAGVQPVLMAAGRVRSILIYRLAYTIPSLAALIVVASHGLMWAASVKIFTAIVQVSLGIFLSRDLLRVGLRDLMIGMRVNIVPTVVVGIVALLARTVWDGGGFTGALILLVAAVIGSSAWIATLALIRHELWQETAGIRQSLHSFYARKNSQGNGG